jgi:hypothetical protein
MPDAFPTVYTADWLDLYPSRVELVATVADPFRAELPGLAVCTALYV